MHHPSIAAAFPEHTYTQPDLHSWAEEASNGERCLLPALLPISTSKQFAGIVRVCLIAARAVSAMFKHRRREQRGSHFTITLPHWSQTTEGKEGEKCRDEDGGGEHAETP